MIDKDPLFWDHLPKPLILINGGGIIQEINPYFEKFTGFKGENIKGIGKPYPWMIENKVNDIRGKKKSFKKKDGTRFKVKEKSVFVNDSGSEILLWDIIPKKKEEEIKLKKKLQKLERSNVGLKQFAYVASHDLREPLRIVKSFSQLFQIKYEDLLDEKGEEYLANIIKSVNRMENLVEDLLSFSRLQTMQDHKFNIVSLEKIFNIVLKNLEHTIEENNAKILQKNNFPEISCIRSQIIQLFQNLISNAIKFNNKKIPKVEISFTEKKFEWKFAIKDNGIGIDEKYFEKIFIAFKRLHSWSDYQGSGIGLSICKQIVENHGGKIWVESKVGEGSTFYFTLNKKKGM